jgi:hypothetical protein
LYRVIQPGFFSWFAMVFIGNIYSAN